MKLFKNYSVHVSLFFSRRYWHYFSFAILVFISGKLTGQITIEDQEYCGPGFVTFISNDPGCELYEWTFENDNQIINTGCTFTTPEIALNRSYNVSNGISQDVIVQAIDTCVSNSCNTTGELLLDIDFDTGTDNGPALAPGITSLNFNNNAQNPGTQLDGSQYAIVSTTAGLNFGWWGNSGSQEILDNTPGDVNGKMLVVNAATNSAEFYRVAVDDVCPSSFYVFSASFINVLNTSGSPCGANEIPFDVNFRIEDNAGNILGSEATGQVFGSNTLPTWRQIDFKFYIPSDVTEIELVLVNNIGGDCGNDLAIDDIQLQQCQPDFLVLSSEDVCLGSGTTLRSSAGPELTTSVFQWQKSTDGGLVWEDVVDATADTVFVADNDIEVTDSYRLSATNQIDFNTTGCVIFTEPISITRAELPSLLLDDLSICSGETFVNASFTIDGDTPDVFGIDWNTIANNSGLSDIPFGASLPASPLVINGFGAVQAGGYEGDFIIENTTSGCRDTVPISANVRQKPDITQFACGSFETVEASDFGFGNNTTGNTSSADLSAKFGLEPGSIIVDANNVSVDNSGLLMTLNGGVPNKSTFTFSGTRAVKTKATHGPIQTSSGTTGRDGVISEDLIPQVFTGNLNSPFTANSEGNEYFIPNVTGTSVNLGTQIWESSDFTTGLSFYTVGLLETNIISLELCPQVALEACDSLVLPVISGSTLSSPLYYTAPNQGGTALNADDVLTTNGTYYVFDEVNSCTDEERFTVEILSTPEFNIVNERTSCDSLVLGSITGSNLSSDLTYFTNLNGGLPALAVGENVFSSTKLYVFDEVIGQDIVCGAQDSVEIQILRKPIIQAFADTPVCGAYLLEEIMGSNLTATRSYFQFPNGGLPQFMPGDQISNTTTLYAFNEVGSGLSCFSEEAITITVTQGPILEIIDDESVCDQFVLPPIEGTNLTTNRSYFTMPDGNGQSLEEGSQINETQTLYAYDPGNSSGDCEAEQSFLVTVLETPIISSIASDTTICQESSVDIFISASPAEQLNWFSIPDSPNTPISSSPSLEVRQSGGYYAVLSNGACVVTSDTVDVELIEVSVTASAAPSEICVGEMSELTTASTNADSITWFNLSDNSFVFGTEQIVSPNRTTIYSVVALSSSGCKDSTNIQVKVVSPLVAPNVFTPNGDGENDTFVIQGIETLPDAIVRVFNRWGVLIYETSNYSANEWDAKNAPDGVYYYLIEFNAKNQANNHTGVIHVLH